MAAARTSRTCPMGHVYHKSSDCPTCPDCEAAKKETAGFMWGLSAPAQRALQNAGITTPEKLAGFSEEEALALHGLGPASLPVLRAALRKQGLAFRKDGPPRGPAGKSGARAARGGPGPRRP